MAQLALFVLVTSALLLWARSYDWLQHESAITTICRLLPEHLAGHINSFVFGPSIRAWWRVQATSIEQVRELEKTWGVAPIGPPLAAKWLEELQPHGQTLETLAKWRTRTHDMNEIKKWSIAGFTYDDALPWLTSRPPFSPREAHLWDSYQFSAHEARIWSDHGFSTTDGAEWAEGHAVSAEHAAQWRKFGGLAGEVGEWIESGFATNLHNAWQWRTVGAGPTDAKAWGPHFTPVDAQRWSDQGFSPDNPSRNPLQWREVSSDPQTAGRWFDAGFDSESAQQWIDICEPFVANAWLSEGFDNPRDVQSYIDAGCTPSEARAWTSELLIDPALILRWKQAGVTAQTFPEWRDAGFLTPDKVQGWPRLGLHPSVAARWSDITSSVVAERWITAGVIPDIAAQWIERGIPYEQAEAWIQAGFSDPKHSEVLRRINCSIEEYERWLACEVTIEDLPRERRFWSIDDYERWFTVSATTELKREWKFLGTPEDVLELQLRGIPDQQITGWLQSQLPLNLVDEWLQHGIDEPSLIVKWSALQVLPEEAIQWINAGVLSPENISDWLSLGLTFDEIDCWSNQLRMTSEQAASWLSNGISSDEAQLWQEIGVSFYDVAIQWMNHGFDPKDARSWATIANPADARQWITEGFTPEVATSWINEGLSVSESQMWLASGIEDAASAREFMSAHVPVHEAVLWLSIGLSPGQAIEERQHWDPATCQMWMQLPIELSLARRWSKLHQFTDIERFCSAGCSANQINQWLDEGLELVDTFEWVENGFLSPDIAYPWRTEAFSGMSARRWHEVGAEPVLARAMEDARLPVRMAPHVSAVARDEGVDPSSAIWRATLDDNHVQRYNDLPLFSPDMGCSSLEQLQELADSLFSGGASHILVRHLAPNLTSEMINALPQARILKGSVKKSILELCTSAPERFAICSPFTGTDETIVKIGRDKHLPTFHWSPSHDE